MLSRAQQRDVPVKRPLPGTQGNAFAAEYHMVSARVLPMSGTATAQMYGLQPSEMRMLLCGAGADLLRGDGVCVDVEAGAEPDFRVEYVAKWLRHWAAHLRYIPPGERGADE